MCQTTVAMFEDKECPSLDNVDKPPPGSGLNAKAKVELDGCRLVDKTIRELIKDENRAQMLKRLKGSRGMKDTKFESFDMKDGKWTF
jgi:nuclear pore complex protein Nup98-Nup96